MDRLWQYQRLAEPVAPAGQEAETIYSSSWHRPTERPPDPWRAVRRAAFIAAIPFFFFQETQAAPPAPPDLISPETARPVSSRPARVYPHHFFVQVPNEQRPLFGLQPTFEKRKTSHLAPFYFSPELAPAPVAPPWIFEQAADPPGRRFRTAHLAQAFTAHPDLPPPAPSAPTIPTGQISQPLFGKPKTAHRAETYFAPVEPPPPPPAAPSIRYPETERPPRREQRAPWAVPFLFYREGDPPVPDVPLQISRPVPARNRMPHLWPEYSAQVDPPAPPPPAPEIRYPETERPPSSRKRAPHLAPAFFYQGEPIAAAPVQAIHYLGQEDIAVMLQMIGQEIMLAGVTVMGLLDVTDVQLLEGSGSGILAKSILVTVYTNDIPPGFTIGDQVVAAGMEYVVHDRRQIGDGALTELLLAERAAG